MPSPSLPILTYHSLATDGAVTSTDPARIIDTVDALLEAGHRAVDLCDWVAQGCPDIGKGFALTFDDGYRSILTVADQLASRNVPATVFLLADRIGTDNDWPGQPRDIPRAPLLDRSDIAVLADLGFRFGSHGLDHPRFDRLDPLTLEGELIRSRDVIEAIANQPCTLLAYPYGESSPRVRFAAWKIYRAAFGTRLAYASRRDNPLDLPRIDAYYLRDRSSLDLMIAGRWHGRLAVRRTLRTIRRWVEA